MTDRKNKKNFKRSKYEFEGQKAAEEVILRLKRHPMTMYKTGLVLVAAFLLVVISFSIFGASKVSSYVLGAYILAGGFLAFKTWYLWNNSYYLLSNERVIAVDQEGLFFRKVSEATLDKIQNVTYKTEGMYQTLVNYGDVKILTAGQKDSDVLFKMVPSPYNVQQEITTAAYKYGGKSILLEDK